MIKRLIFPLLATFGICLAGTAQAANVTDEVEPNHPISAPQQLSVPGTLSVMAFLGNGGADDLDYFTFYGRAGDVVTIDVDGAWGGTNYMDSVLAVFDPAANYARIRFNDDASLDDGSTSTMDSRIDDFVVPATGYYVVGVSNFPRYFVDGGGVINQGNSGRGDYTLVISGASNPVKQVAIRVRPGKGEARPVNPKSRGRIPVAILGGPEFNPLTIDKKSLTFGASGDEDSLHRCNWRGTDLNHDGRVDLICHFDTQKANFTRADTEGTVKGETKDGMPFEGTGFVQAVPAK